jgi:hypothetical protein
MDSMITQKISSVIVLREGSLMTQMIMNTNRRMQMAYNPKTYNLFQQIDISNALEKAKKHLDETEEESPSICIKSDKPFALAMRFARYIRAFREQMKSVEDIDEGKYDLLRIMHDKDVVRITHSMETKQLNLINEQTGEEL